MISHSVVRQFGPLQSLFVNRDHGTKDSIKDSADSLLS